MRPHPHDPDVPERAPEPAPGRDGDAGRGPAARRFPIRLKMMASTIVVLLLAGAFMAVYYPARYADHAREVLETRTMRMAETVALGIGITFDANRMGAVATVVNWARQDSSLAYIEVYDTAGQYLAGMNPAELVIDRANITRRLNRVVRNGDILETAVPIRFQDRGFGTLFLGMSMAGMWREVEFVRLVALFVSLIAFALGTAVALLLADRITRELETARDNALAAAQAKSEFLAAMSHEIRTPMNGVLGMLEMLGTTGLNGRQREYIGTASSSGRALLTIIDDILDFTKIEAGKLEVEHTVFDLRAVVDDVVTLLARRASAKDVALYCIVHRDVPRSLVGDPVRIRQILLNLGGNAVKFTPAGTITFRVEVKRFTEGGAVIRFRVTDTGIGISTEAQARLFQPFSQADTSTTRRFGGTGLGLSICRRLVNLMGGHIGVRSSAGRGSEFWFTVPTEIADAPADVPEVVAGQRILVLETEAPVLEGIVELVGAWGAAPYGAATLEDALAAVAGSGDAPPFGLTLLGVDFHDRIDELRDALVAGGSAALIVPLSARTDEAAEEETGRRYFRPIGYSGLRTLLSELRPAPDDDGAAPTEPGDGVVATGADPDPTVASSELQGTRILLVEDNPVNQTVVAAMLEYLGAEPTLAADGHDALSRLAETRFDAVLMDCHMPGLDGYDATSRIRRSESAARTGHIPIIALTASALQGERERCLAAGMDDYLTKPVSLESLAICLRQWVGRSTRAQRGVPRRSEPLRSAPARATRPRRAAASSSLPTLDRDALASIRALRSVDGRNPLELVVGQFLAATPGMLDALGSAAAAGDAEALRAIAHSLKSSSSMVGARRLADILREAERAATDGAAGRCVGLLDDVRAEYDAVVQALTALTPEEANVA